MIDRGNFLKLGCVQPRQKVAKPFFKRKRWCDETPCSDDARVAICRLRRPFFVLFLKNSQSLMKLV